MRLASIHSISRLALAAGLAAAAAVPAYAEAKKTGAVVGLVTELSGPASLFGEAGLQAAQLAADEVNAAGGVLGGRLELKVADDNTDPNTARQVWEKLVSEGVDAIIFRETSAARVAALPVAEKANIPALYANDYEGGDCRPILYVTGEIEPQKVPAYLKFLKDKAGGGKFFILATDYNWARITTEMVKKAAPGLGIEIIGEEFTPFSTTDYTPLITKIRDSGANVLFSGIVGGPDNVAFFKQARSSGLMQKIKVIGNIALDDTTLSAVGGAANGTYMAASYFMTNDSPGNAEVRRSSQEEVWRRYEAARLSVGTGLRHRAPLCRGGKQGRNYRNVSGAEGPFRSKVRWPQGNHPADDRPARRDADLYRRGQQQGLL